MTGVGRSLIPIAVLLMAGCQGSTRPAAVPSTIPVTTSTISASGPLRTSPSSSVPIQTGGPRTVLSAIGLNLRAEPSKTSAVVGTAAEGTILTVVSHTDQGGGWYQVKGATVTGFITDSPTLSAEGKFTAYSSDHLNFSALYPEQWAPTELPPLSVVFRPASGHDSLVVTTAQTLNGLGRGRPGYRQDTSTPIVVCGVTGDLVTFVESAPAASSSTSQGATTGERYLVQVHLALDGQHALGVDANLADLAQLQVIKDVVYSVTFPFPRCEQGAAPSDTSNTATAGTATATTIG